jgi:hypothetical protein
MRADFVLGALEQALFDRQPQCHEPLVHHSVDADQQLTKTQPTRERRPVFCPANRPTVSCLDEGAHPKNSFPSDSTYLYRQQAGEFPDTASPAQVHDVQTVFFLWWINEIWKILDFELSCLYKKSFARLA